MWMKPRISSSSYFYSSCHEVTPINNLFRPQDCVRLEVSLIVFMDFFR
jgi:hypothetical protein